MAHLSISSYTSAKSSQPLQMYLVRYFLSANNIYCPSFTNRLFDTLYLSVFTMHSRHRPYLTLSTCLQSLDNL